MRYGALAATGAVRLDFCWAHWRRRFYEIAQAGNAPIASEALVRIATIYGALDSREEPRLLVKLSLQLRAQH